MDRKLLLPSEEGPEQSTRLARILKALRRRRGLTAAAAAGRMGMQLRTYEEFESGRGKLKLERIQEFADALGCDAFAIVLALAFDDEQFAVSCADTKLTVAVLMVLQDFARDAGPDLARLDARVVMQVLDSAFAQLTQEARGRRPPGHGD